MKKYGGQKSHFRVPLNKRSWSFWLFLPVCTMYSCVSRTLYHSLRHRGLSLHLSWHKLAFFTCVHCAFLYSPDPVPQLKVTSAYPCTSAGINKGGGVTCYSYQCALLSVFPAPSTQLNALVAYPCTSVGSKGP